MIGEKYRDRQFTAYSTASLTCPLVLPVTEPVAVGSQLNSDGATDAAAGGGGCALLIVLEEEENELGDNRYRSSTSPTSFLLPLPCACMATATICTFILLHLCL